jgi:hypothetical protein
MSGELGAVPRTRRSDELDFRELELFERGDFDLLPCLLRSAIPKNNHTEARWHSRHLTPGAWLSEAAAAN